jgi:hypothetical protein
MSFTWVLSARLLGFVTALAAVGLTFQRGLSNRR